MGVLRGVRLAAGAAAVAVVLSACQGQPGAAAFVGEDRISDRTVSDWVRAVAGSRPADAPAIDAPDFSRKVLSVLIRQPLLQATADRLGVDVGEAAIDEVMGPVVEEAGGEEAYAALLEQNGIPGEHADTWRQVDGMQRLLADAVVADVVIPESRLQQVWTSDPALQSQAFEDVVDDIRRDLLAEEAGTRLLAELQISAEELGVDTSPRYGAFDTETLQVTATVPDTVRTPDLGETPLPQ